MMDVMGSVMGGPGMAGIWVPVLLWAGLLAFLAWVLAGMTRSEGRPAVEERPVVARVGTIEDVLRGRLARGEISAGEFEDALRQLRDS